MSAIEEIIMLADILDVSGLHIEAEEIEKYRRGSRESNKATYERFLKQYKEQKGREYKA